MDARKFFQDQQQLHNQLHRKLQQATTHIAGIRVGSFILTIVAFVYFVNQRQLPYALGALIVFFIAFILLVKRHNKLRFSRDQHRHLADINTEELARLDGVLDNIYGGKDFQVDDHAYAEDLDILGKHSLYQMLNRTSTFPGKKLLADRLLGKKCKANLSECKEYLSKRQVSLSSLAQMPEFMQEYQALGRHVLASNDDFKKFTDWLQSPTQLSHKPAFRFWIYFLPALFVIGLAITSIFSITYYTLLPLIIINLGLLARQHKYAVAVVEKTSQSLKMLKSFVHHLELIEQQSFSADLLVELAKTFNKEGYSAKAEINKIAGLLDHLQTRNNIFHVFINVPLLLDIHWLWRIEKWQETNRENVQHWFDTLAEFEVMISLAGQAFAHPDWTMPVINSTPYYLSGEEIGHPLIPEQTRVTNSFAMQGAGQVVLLTGPNMAGKSTFLRTIGVNIIMAQMGGVVCASSFELNPDMAVFTAMRIKDDLSESISSFYAELSRIKQLLERVEKGESVLYFLDEILKGTNSADRHKGAEALIKQLSELKVSGFVSTHDLELGELAKKLEAVQNYSFESIIEGGNINFDYKLRDGICTSFNACELMRQMGIRV